LQTTDGRATSPEKFYIIIL